MPLIASNFTPSIPFKNGHLNTVYRSLFSKEQSNYTRKRIKTWDYDFIDLDFSTVQSDTVVILIHGLEGSSESKYMISTTKELNKNQMDVIAFNLRGCSGEDNLLLRTYHSGKTEDVDFVVNHILSNYTYKKIALVGFSLGGNLILKYLGEYTATLSDKIKVAIAVSTPIDITSSERELEKLKNKIYVEEFLKTIRIKIAQKSEKFPEFTVDKIALQKANTFEKIEKLYTVPVFGFDDPQDYWKKASSKPYISKINKPTLLINAKDDSFLAKECFPYDEALASDYFHLETPNYGGHVGFITSFKQKENYWLENRICNFIKENS